MLVYLLFLLFFILVLIFLSLGSYYFRIFRDPEKDNFTRNELIDVRSIFVSEFISTLEHNGNLQYGIIAFLVSAVLGHLWTFLGGIIGRPFYANEFGNYFFLSFLLPVGLMAAYPYIFDAFFGEKRESNPFSPLVQFFSQEIPIVSGVSLSVVAANLTVYGYYHEIYFLFVLINVLIILSLLVYKITADTFFGIAPVRRQMNESFNNVDEFDDEELEI
ncbi:MAG: hypothetical protein H7A25_08005 [Leptospiraceae bacterium]|nr:hypothetical protein [Leptospiraceae bacterium]MCP5499829.1 hypothetical protein [Leptospiraceae bacterium]